MTRRIARRGGFTLIELLVVVSLIIALAAITITVSFGGLSDSHRAVAGLDRASQWLLIAKQRAKRDGSPVGVRFYVTSGLVKEAQYIEQPPAYAPQPMSSSPNRPPQMELDYSDKSLVVLRDVDAVGVMNNVGVGDTMSLPDFNLLLKVQSVNPGSRTNSGDNTAVRIGVDSMLFPNAGTNTTMYRSPNVGFYRAPRPMAGEETLQLAPSMAVDAGLSTGLAIQNGSFDILFAPNGQVVNSAADGIIALWMRDPTQPAPTPNNRTSFEKAGSMGLVVVYPKTGRIATHPVALPSEPDPFRYAKDGINTGM